MIVWLKLAVSCFGKVEAFFVAFLLALYALIAIAAIINRPLPTGHLEQPAPPIATTPPEKAPSVPRYCATDKLGKPSLYFPCDFDTYDQFKI